MRCKRRKLSKTRERPRMQHTHTYTYAQCVMYAVDLQYIYRIIEMTIVGMSNEREHIMCTHTTKAKQIIAASYCIYLIRDKYSKRFPTTSYNIISQRQHNLSLL